MLLRVSRHERMSVKGRKVMVGHLLPSWRICPSAARPRRRDAQIIVVVEMRIFTVALNLFYKQGSLQIKAPT